MKRLKVDLGDRSYPILIADGPLQNVGVLMRRYSPASKVCIVTNTTVRRLYADVCVTSLQNAGFKVSIVALPDGERYKTLRGMDRIYDGLIRAGLDRSDAVLALGGGVTGDMAGFAAATYMRGINFVQFPTTLLAQVDSSVGGKTGVDHPGGKNIVGAFYQPKLVVCDLSTLSSLPQREYRCGLAEVLKYGVIKSATFFSYLEKSGREILDRKQGALEKIVAESCRLKAAVVVEDERESGIRAILNYGHTFGHGIETAMNFRTIKHGEAVAIGMVMAAHLSYLLGLASAQSAVRVENLVSSYGLPTKLPRGLSPAKVMAGMEHDKKIIGGKWRFVVFDKIGHALVQGGLTRKEIAAVIR